MEYWVMSLKCYSDWKFGAIQNDLTPLKLRFTENSAKQQTISLLFTEIYIIWTAWRLEYILCFACTFRDVNTNEGILTWSKVAVNFGITIRWLGYEAGAPMVVGSLLEPPVLYKQLDLCLDGAKDGFTVNINLTL